MALDLKAASVMMPKMSAEQQGVGLFSRIGKSTIDKEYVVDER
jgi:hypothetical protein